MKKIDKNLKNKNKSQRGFTLIETFMAITILLIAMTGPLVLVTKGLSISKLAKGQITATYLAQEAVEYIRNVRDSNILNERDWLIGLDDCVVSGRKCKIDSPNQEVDLCSTEGCENLKYNAGSNLYEYSSGEISRFKREIEIIEVSSNKELEIIVDMFWVDGPSTRQFTVKERLLNWQ